MKGYRERPMNTIDGSPVTEMLDYVDLKGRLLQQNEEFTLDMPTTSNVLQYRTADGTKLSIRPSGTEPKIKYYIEVHLKVKEGSDLEVIRQEARAKVERIKSELAI